MKACRFERAVLLSLYLVKLLVFEKFYLDEGVQIGEGYAFESVFGDHVVAYVYWHGCALVLHLVYTCVYVCV